MDFEEPPLHRGHRHASEAAAAESSRSWTKAMYKHQEAANCFLECLGLTAHPQANRAILLLISKHTKRFEDIREKLSYHKSMKDILKSTGYHHRKQNDPLNEEIYQNLRLQMQRIVSIAHKNIIISNEEQEDNDGSNDIAHRQQMVNKLS